MIQLFEEIFSMVHDFSLAIEKAKRDVEREARVGKKSHK